VRLPLEEWGYARPTLQLPDEPPAPLTGDELAQLYEQEGPEFAAEDIVRRQREAQQHDTQRRAEIAAQQREVQAASQLKMEQDLTAAKQTAAKWSGDTPMSSRTDCRMRRRPRFTATTRPVPGEVN